MFLKGSVKIVHTVFPTNNSPKFSRSVLQPFIKGVRLMNVV